MWLPRRGLRWYGRGYLWYLPDIRATTSVDTTPHATADNDLSTMNHSQHSVQDPIESNQLSHGAWHAWRQVHQVDIELVGVIEVAIVLLVKVVCLVARSLPHHTPPCRTAAV